MRLVHAQSVTEYELLILPPLLHLRFQLLVPPGYAAHEIVSTDSLIALIVDAQLEADGYVRCCVTLAISVPLSLTFIAIIDQCTSKRAAVLDLLELQLGRG